LQEYYLSRRTITFVNNQAYFRCRQKNWYEELWTDLEPKLPRGPDIDVITFARDNMDMGIRSVATYTFLFQVLEVYQNRNLTDENDALNAVAGILRRVAASAKTKMVQGLPADIFPLAILFLHTDRRAPRRRKKFPSWSWCGWKGQVSWYPFDRLDLMNAANEENDFNEDKELEEALSHNWLTYYITEGTHRSEIIWTPVAQQQHVGNVNGALDLFRALPALADADLKLDTANLATTTLTDLEESRIRDYPLLTFHTMALHYTVKTIPQGGDMEDYQLDAERPSFKEYTSRTYEISGREDEDCGVLYADKRLILEEDNVTKFVILGECHNIEFLLEFDPYCDSIAEEPIFWVMMIRLINGIWERRGIGQILQTSLGDSFPPGPRWEHIVLG
jgi:hypothetical protein